MTASLDIATPHLVQSQLPDAGEVAAELAAGLRRPQATICPKHFYDPLGSALFGAICALDEYYPTRTEAAVLQSHGAEIARCAGEGRTLIDLGAGDCLKAEGLIPLLRPRRYVAVDISVQFLHQGLQRVQQRFPQLAVAGLGQDFAAGLTLPAPLGDGPATLFYPGSSIGNFTPDEAVRFLRSAREAAPRANLLVGVDLVKDRTTLERAYDDALGVTAAFNLNVLRNVNARLGTDFDPAQWRHVAFFDARRSRIEMHLEARRACTVRWLGGERRFSAGERIHTENSYKYEPEDFATLLRDAGWARAPAWTDPRRWFAVFCASD
jgi:dimethylhistidine N-methyltransferase